MKQRKNAFSVKFERVRPLADEAVHWGGKQKCAYLLFWNSPLNFRKKTRKRKQCMGARRPKCVASTSKISKKVGVLRLFSGFQRSPFQRTHTQMYTVPQKILYVLNDDVMDVRTCGPWDAPNVTFKSRTKTQVVLGNFLWSIRCP